MWTRAREEFADAVAFARSSPSPERDEAFFGAYVGDRNPNDPVHAIESRERDAFLRGAGIECVRLRPNAPRRLRLARMRSVER